MTNVLPPPRPPVRQSYYSYTIVDVSTEPPTPVDVRMTRAECRELIGWRDDADNLRIRRGRTTLYQS